jgi:hypothetical protein
MLKNKKLLAVVPVLLFVAYTMTKPKPPVVKHKINGTIYQMPGSFLLNLSDGRYVKLSMALELAPGQSDGASADSGGSATESTVGTLPEEAVVREIVTNLVTNMNSETIINTNGRHALKQKILSTIRAQTDLKLEAVLIPDITVQ